jgi:predicted transcriptional regulator
MNRATVHLDPKLHRALRRRAADTERTIADLVDDAVRDALAKDKTDVAAIAARAGEPVRPFEAFVRDLKRRGKAQRRSTEA